MDNLVDSSSESESEFEWNIDNNNVDNDDNKDVNKGDTKKKNIFLNNDSESDVLNTLNKKPNTSTYKILLTSDNSSNFTKYFDQYNFKGVTNFEILGLTFNMPSCSWFDVIIPSLPSECFYLNDLNESILFRQHGVDYDKDLKEDTTILHGSLEGDLNIHTIIETVTIGTNKTLTLLIDNIENLNVTIKFPNKFNSDTLLPQLNSINKGIVKEYGTIFYIDIDTGIFYINFKNHSIKNILGVEQGFIEEDGEFKWLINILGNTMSISPDSNYNSQISSKDISISTSFKNSQNIDINTIKIFVKLYFSPSFIKNNEYPWINLNKLNDKKIEIYPINNLTIKNVLNLMNLNRPISYLNKIESKYKSDHHLYLSLNITAENS